MPFHIVVCDDISLMQVDAVVNPANPGLLSDGGGVCGALFRRAGEDRMRAACAKVGGCPVGGAVATPGFDLPARFVVHAAGPVWRGGDEGEEELLLSCYRSALDLADELGAASVALPLVSTGAFGVPIRLGLSVARRAVGAFLRNHDQEVYLVVPERRAVDIGSSLFQDIARRLDDAGLIGPVCDADGLASSPPPLAAGPSAARPPRARPIPNVAPSCSQGLPSLDGGPVPPAGQSAPRRVDRFAEAIRSRFGRGTSQELGELLGNLDASFSQTLLRLIDERGMTDAQAYRRANVSRQLFSKIRNDPAYRPSKQTVLAFAVALGLTLPETSDLLGRAGFALSHASASDVIVEYFIGQGCHDLFLINEALFAFDQPLLGA